MWCSVKRYPVQLCRSRRSTSSLLASSCISEMQRLVRLFSCLAFWLCCCQGKQAMTSCTPSCFFCCTAAKTSKLWVPVFDLYRQDRQHHDAPCALSESLACRSKPKEACIIVCVRVRVCVMCAPSSYCAAHSTCTPAQVYLHTRYLHMWCTTCTLHM